MSLERNQTGTGRGRRAGAQRWTKNQIIRFERRKAKADPEGAPRQRRYRGYD